MERTRYKFHFIVNCPHTAICNHIYNKTPPNKSLLLPAEADGHSRITKHAGLNVNVLPATWAADPREMRHQSGSSPFCEAERC